MDDDAFLGLNHQHFPDMDGVSEGGDPPGSSNRPRQCLEPTGMSSAPSFDETVHAIANFDANQIQQLLQVAQMQFDTKSAASQPCGYPRIGWGHKKIHDCTSVAVVHHYKKDDKTFSQATSHKEFFFLRMRGKDLHSTVPFLRCLPALTALLFRSLRLKSVSTCPSQKSIRGLEACLRVRASLGSGWGFPLGSVTKVSASLPVCSVNDPVLKQENGFLAGVVVNDLDLKSVNGENDSVPEFWSVPKYGCRSGALTLERVMRFVLLMLEGRVCLRELMTVSRLIRLVRHPMHVSHTLMRCLLLLLVHLLSQLHFALLAHLLLLVCACMMMTHLCMVFSKFKWYWWPLACAEVHQLLPGLFVVGHG